MELYCQSSWCPAHVDAGSLHSALATLFVPGGRRGQGGWGAAREPLRGPPAQFARTHGPRLRAVPALAAVELQALSCGGQGDGAVRRDRPRLQRVPRATRHDDRVLRELLRPARARLAVRYARRPGGGDALRLHAERVLRHGEHLRIKEHVRDVVETVSTREVAADEEGRLERCPQRKVGDALGRRQHAIARF